MTATEKKGVWTEQLPKDFSMEIDTNTNKIKVFKKSHLITIDIGHDIYPEDVEKARAKVQSQFIGKSEKV